MLKNLAVILQAASTGGWRFASQLCIALKSAYPHLELVTYLGKQVLNDFSYDKPAERLQHAGVIVKPFAVKPPAKKRSGLRALAAYFRNARRQKIYAEQIDMLNEHDLVFYAWPYNLDFPMLSRPIAFIPHDFFYLHFTGGFQDSNRTAQNYRDQHLPWMQFGFPVVSSRFIAKDLQAAFPQTLRNPEVIHIANLSPATRLPSLEANKVVQSLGISSDYVLCLNNASYHKNLGQVLAGFHYANEAFPKLQLVVCGHETDGVWGRANSPFYIDRFDPHPNVFCLGLRSDREVTALIQNAKAVINASLYEAGNGSGLDAWHLGTPVAMSAIPPFLEQMEVLGVQAETFNPRCCFEIRDALLSILGNEDRAAMMAKHSQSSLHAYTWEHVAQKYMAFFEGILQEPKQSSYQ